MERASDRIAKLLPPTQHFGITRNPDGSHYLVLPKGHGQRQEFRGSLAEIESELKKRREMVA